MIGSPCSATASSLASVFLLINREQELDPSALEPYTAVFNTTPSDNQYTIASTKYQIVVFYCIQVYNLTLLIIGEFRSPMARNGLTPLFFHFRTRDKDCSSVPCVSGSCDESTLICTCNYGWGGNDCSIAPSKDSNCYFCA